jgi:hypothetical protein
MDTDMDMEMEVEDEAAPTPAPLPPAAHPLPESSKLNIRKTYTRAYDMLSNKALKVQGRKKTQTLPFISSVCYFMSLSFSSFSSCPFFLLKSFLHLPKVCPICKQEVAVNEMAEHMRIELLDPRYQAEKRAMLEKIGVSALASGDEITKQLKKFADRRTDIFGNEELEIGRSVIEEEVPQKDPSAIWDGHTASIGRTSTAAHGMSIDDQINAIHQR